MPDNRFTRIAEGVFINGLYDLIKVLLGGAVIVFGLALWRSFRHIPIDWWGILALFIFVCVVFGVLIRLHSQNAGAKSDSGADASQSGNDQKQHETPIFDAEIYRIFIAPKIPFANETQQLVETMIRREFTVDVDLLVELYVVNVSDRTQYVRDIEASVEVDRLRPQVLRQNDFDAYDVNGIRYEYGTDPSPNENRLLASDRATGMNALVPSFPAALEARKPLDGWVHFVVKDVDPKQIERNETLQFVIVDSMGKRYPVSRLAGTTRPNAVVLRQKR